MAMPLWVREKLFQKSLLNDELKDLGDGFDAAGRLLFTEHHQSHAASAFFPSPFEEALVLTMDGVGEWATTSAALGRGNQLEIIREIHFPHSLGLLYSAFTYYTGFKVNSGEYKVMGLAPYGEPRYAQQIFDHLIDLKADGSFHLNLEYFNYCTGLTMTNGKFDALFGGPPRRPDELLTQRHMDLAASVQAVLEETMLRMTRSLQAETGARNLCLAGGVALNCVANGKVLRDGQFERIWIQPAAGDAGGALGAALAAYYVFQGPAAPGQWLRRPHARLLPRTRVLAIRHRTASQRRPARSSRCSTTARCWTPARTRSPPKRPWDGSRDAWSSARARWVRAPSSVILARPRCSPC